MPKIHIPNAISRKMEPSPATPPAPESAPRCSFGGPILCTESHLTVSSLFAPGFGEAAFIQIGWRRIDIAFPANHSNGIHPSDLWLISLRLAPMDIQ